MPKKKEITISDLGKTVNTLSGKFDKLSGTVNELTGTVDNLAHSAAKGFESMATKQELKSLEIKLSIKIESGFSLIMEAVGPMRRDYETLRNDLVPRMSTVEARLTKVERKTAI